MIKRILLALALALASIGPTSAPAAPVANINLANGITAFSRTSGSGVTPMTWSITFASNVHEGDYLHLIVYSDGSLSTIVQDIRHRLSHADMQSGATLSFTADGMTAPTATQYLKVAVEQTSPLGLGYAYAFPTAITPTDAFVFATWNAADKDAGITLSGGNLTAARTSGTEPAVRATKAITHNSYIESIVNTANQLDPSVADASAALNNNSGTQSWTADLFGGGGANPHAAAYYKSGHLDYNGTDTNPLDAFTDSATVDQAENPTTHKAWWRINNGSWMPSGDPAAGTGGLNISAMTGSPYFAAHFNNAGSITTNFGATAWARTPPAGYTAP